MPPLPSPDDDTAQAVATKWNADPTLTKLVPGKLERGVLSQFQPAVDAPRVARKQPYATLAVSKGAEGDHNTGPAYMDTRLVTIEIYGLRADVAPVLQYLRDGLDNGTGGSTGPVFNRQPLATLGRLVGVMQLDTDELKEVKDQPKQGEKIWVGTIQLHVLTMRFE